MTNLERIKVLKKLIKRYYDLSLGELESLNWAIKVCHKYESKRTAGKIYD